MKKAVFSASILVAGVAFAGVTDVVGDYVIGVMPVSADGKKEVVLSVPWVEEGGLSDGIAVTNLVKTAGLSEGDTLTWYNTSSGKFQCWRVAAGTGGTNYWEGVEVTGEAGSSQTPPTDAALKQGQAIVLTRDETETDNRIYVVGQVGTNATVTTTLPSHDGSADKWYLLAPPVGLTSTVDFNTCASVAGGWVSCVGDEITIDVASTGLPVKYSCADLGAEAEPRYVWTSSKYGSSHAATIPAGRGFWYKRAKANQDALTITWAGVPHVSSAE